MQHLLLSFRSRKIPENNTKASPDYDNAITIHTHREDNLTHKKFESTGMWNVLKEIPGQGEPRANVIASQGLC